MLVATSRIAGFLAEQDIPLDAVVGSGSDPAERSILPRSCIGRDLVVRTDGPKGGRYEMSDGRSETYGPVAPPGPVVDAYGAGDSFAAGLAFGLASGMDVDEALRLAARCGAWCVAGRGPYGNQLRAADLDPPR